MRCRFVVLATICTSLLPAADTLVQNQDCAGCHPAETKLHERTRMAHAMVPALDSAFGKNLPDRPLRESGDGYEFRFGRTPTGISMTAERGSDTREGVIDWVMGAGAQGQTPLVRAQNGILESRISYFPQLHQYGITIGQDGGVSPNAVAASRSSPKSRRFGEMPCLSRDSHHARPGAAIPGIQCQRCHRERMNTSRAMANR